MQKAGGIPSRRRGSRKEAQRLQLHTDAEVRLEKI